MARPIADKEDLDALWEYHDGPAQEFHGMSYADGLRDMLEWFEEATAIGKEAGISVGSYKRDLVIGAGDMKTTLYNCWVVDVGPIDGTFTLSYDKMLKDPQ